MNDLTKQDSEVAINNERIKIQNFHKLVNRNPNPSEIQTNTHANNSKYLPISFLEMFLDEVMFGLWQTENFQYSVIANEIVCTLELKYFHPSAKCWITRVGVGASMILQNKGADITDISQKIKNTLVKDFPHAKAQAFRNACQSIGKSFGRDLNREHEDLYNPIIKSGVVNELDVLKQKIIDALDIYQDSDKEEIKQMCVDKIKSGEFNKKFAESVAKTIGLKL